MKNSNWIFALHPLIPSQMHFLLPLILVAHALVVIRVIRIAVVVVLVVVIHADVLADHARHNVHAITLFVDAVVE